MTMKEVDPTEPIVEESNADRFDRLRKQHVEPLREKAGMVEDEPVTFDQMEAYVSLLEATVIGMAAAGEMLRRMRVAEQAAACRYYIDLLCKQTNEGDK